MAVLLMEPEYPGVTAEQYDTVDRRVGSRSPRVVAGLLSHCAIITDAGLRVVDLWQSEESMEAFLARLVPVTRQLGLPDFPATPRVTETYHHYCVIR